MLVSSVTKDKDIHIPGKVPEGVVTTACWTEKREKCPVFKVLESAIL